MTEVLETLVGPIKRLKKVGRGYTHNERVLAVLQDGTSVFAKRAVDEMTAQWLRREFEVYSILQGKPFVPEVIAWVDGDQTVLVLEDMSDSVWPPPWERSHIDAVVATLDEVAACQPAPELPSRINGEGGETGWQGVLMEPGSFLSLGECDSTWLERYGRDLIDASATAPLEGENLLHGDVRSDNICIRAGIAMLIDWNLAAIGNPAVDLAFWLPSLEAEGGPPPEAVMPDCSPSLAAYVAGFFAFHAGLPVIPHAPLVREVQLKQLRTALPWAARLLDIPPPRSL